MEVLNVSDLCKIYGKGENEFLALNNISIKVKKGEFIAIVGKSGSGKSTLLHLLGGLDKPDRGNVIINNQDIYKMSDKELTVFRRKYIGFVYQFYNLIPALTVKENILLPALFDGRKISDKKLEELVKKLGLINKMDAYPNDLSGGQQQRVAIGRALINHPKIILADEPTASLDPQTSRRVMHDLKMLNEEYGMTVVANLHSVELAKEFGDRVIGVRAGQIVYDGKMSETSQAVFDDIYNGGNGKKGEEDA